MTDRRLNLPSTLVRLIETGKWPRSDGPSMWEQWSKPLVPEERVRAFAPDESCICLECPPFKTLADFRDGGGSGDFWPKFGALDQIAAEKALVIGDFGPGSDSPIILDFGLDPIDPPVRRLHWFHEDRRTEWETRAPTFDAFARTIGLVVGP